MSSDPSQVEIGDLAFQCPTTLQHIESGIGMDDFTFQRIEHLSVLMQCPACRQRHVFKVANGRLIPLRLTHRAVGRTEFATTLST